MTRNDAEQFEADRTDVVGAVWQYPRQPLSTGMCDVADRQARRRSLPRQPGDVEAVVFEEEANHVVYTFHASERLGRASSVGGGPDRLP
ncbi:hypothetical protein [Williamsia deligens]|uniref:hypothetical protein n=1 Tax=Williamsia deligens TaxID=321325 RepID=UPI0031E10D9A